MARKPQAEPTADQVPDDKKADAGENTATGPETPATGNEGAAEAGEASAAAAPAEATAPDAASAGTPVKGAEGWEIVVTGPVKGRWRAGRHFGPTPVVIAAVDLTEAQVRAIADDPELTMVPRLIE
jgi:hypothetical protein